MKKSVIIAREMKKKRKKDRESIWENVKDKDFFTTRKVANEVGLSSHLTAARLRELEEDGKVEYVKKSSRSSLWKVAKTWQEKRERMILKLKELNIKYESITCDKCESSKNEECEWAWDPYNTNGDCLGVK